MHFFHDPEFWVLVAAIIFVAAVYKPVGRALTGGLDARAARIRAELDEARLANEIAQRRVVLAEKAEPAE